MRALCYADLQATDGHERSRLNPAKTLQQARVEKFYADLLAIYKQYNCEALWDLGDTTDDRSSVPVPTIDAVIAGLEAFPQSDWNLKLIGNHEQYLRNTKVNVGRLFKPFFNVIDGNAAYSCGEVTIHCASYPAADEELVAWLQKQARTKGPSILLGHFQVLGCQMNSGQAVTGIDIKLLRFANLTLLGHVHAPQSLGKGIHYVGSPFQQNWGEAGEQKRVGIVDTDSCEVNWIPLRDYPSYREVSVDEFADIDISTTEDRFKVVITNPDEAQRFYSTPSSGAVEPVYSYDVAATVESSGTLPAEEGGWGIEDVMRRYMKKTPIQGLASEVSEADLLQFGADIMNG